MTTIKTVLTAATLAAVIIAAAPGIIEASERRAEYLAQEAKYFACIEAGASRSICAAEVGW